MLITFLCQYECGLYHVGNFVAQSLHSRCGLVSRSLARCSSLHPYMSQIRLSIYQIPKNSDGTISDLLPPEYHGDPLSG
jgi:hypothetical protein